MAGLTDGCNSVLVCVAGLDASVLKGRPDHGLGRGKALPGLVWHAGFASIDDITGKIGIGDGLPTEVDRCLDAGLRRCGNGGETGGYGGRKDVENFDAYRA